MYNGAWDYGADTRGYTWDWIHEFHTRRWWFRYGSADRRVLRDRADMFEAELHYKRAGHAGAIRVLSFVNHANAGTYADALRLAAQSGATPDVPFLRLGWNDGKTETFAFTAIDRLASAGVSLGGARWKRPFDTAGTALTVSGISGVHAAYLARGGLDFIVGDGALRYAPEYVSETYYSARLFSGIFATADLQRVINPAFNRDRGPLWVSTLRLHVEVGKDSFLHKSP